ncbi:MAG: hypothetical protein J5554_04335 [Paludibacteraceae bacterium]|nr:hypothetical protein [Paludibacteraceae bacterium]
MIRFKLLFILFALIGIFSSCKSDHDHNYGYYDYPYYDGHPYYYRDGVYYQDPYYTHPYAWDSHHFYSARIEWKGDGLRYAIVLRENPYMGMICRPVNLYNYIPYPHDGELMVRFNWLGEENYNGLIIPVIEITGVSSYRY